MDDAGHAQIDQLIEIMDMVRSKLLTVDEWKGLRFVVPGAHMAVREGLVNQVCVWVCWVGLIVLVILLLSILLCLSQF